MELRTKFDIGDVVYFMKDNKVRLGTIDFIQVEISSNSDVDEIYTINYNCSRFTKDSEELFSSKEEELIKSL